MDIRVFGCEATNQWRAALGFSERCQTRGASTPNAAHSSIE
jgi:hypothetical protein